jgi:hypothetical protein
MRTILTTLAVAALLGCDDKKDAAGTQAATADPAGVAGTPAAGRAADKAAGGASGMAEQMEKAAAELEAMKPKVDEFAARAERAAAEMEQTAKAAKAAAGDPVARAREMAAVSGAQGVGAALPGDFPLPPPAGANAVAYADSKEEGARKRTAYFQYSGAHKAVAAHFEKAMKARGLSPAVSAIDTGGVPLTMLTAEKPPLLVEVSITEETPGSNIVVVDWAETLR